MVGKEWEGRTRKTLVAAMVVLAFTAIMLALPGSALALPSEVPDDIPMVDGRVRAIEQVGTNAGQVIRWYNSPSLKSVLAAPGLGRVYGGGVSLSAFDFATGKKLWTKAKTTVDPTIRTHDSSPAYRDLELDADDPQTIWAACICDAVDGNPAKALIKLDIEGNHDASWLTEAGEAAFGQSVVDHNGKLYLAAGGSDFLAEYDKPETQTAGGARGWEVAGEDGDSCGAGRPGDVDKNGIPTLDPNNECASRQGIAAYSFGGQLDPNWHPAYSGSYSLVWELHVEGPRRHTGGEFKKVSGVVQNSYARLSPTSL